VPACIIIIMGYWFCSCFMHLACL